MGRSDRGLIIRTGLLVLAAALSLAVFLNDWQSHRDCRSSFTFSSSGQRIYTGGVLCLNE